MSIATMLQRATTQLAEKEAAATAVVPPLSVAPARTMTIPIPDISTVMLNTNRPIDDVPPAPTIHEPAPSVPALQSTAQTMPSLSFDWKKYLPWILAVLALAAILMMTRKRSA